MKMYLRNLIICFIFSLASARLPRGRRKPSGVVGERDPERGEVRYLVAIHSDSSLCEGGIISERHILTAAHCVHVNHTSGKLLQPMRIIANTNSSSDYGYSAIIIDVARAFFPSNYSKGDPNDIAVLELKENLDFRANRGKIEKLSLPEPLPNNPTKYPTYDNEIIKFAGYGNSDVCTFDRVVRKVIVRSGLGPLRVAWARIKNITYCKKFFKKYGDEPMCTEVTQNESKTNPQGTCKGDSGGPAVYKDRVVIGLDSKGKYCNNNLALSLFTRVSKYILFIKQVMKNDTTGLFVYNA